MSSTTTTTTTTERADTMETLQASAPGAGEGGADGDQPAGTPLTLADVAIINDRLNRGSARMKRIEDGLAENTRVTTESLEAVREVLDLMNAAKAGFRVAGWLGAVIRWVGYLASAAAAIWGFVHVLKGGGDVIPPPGH